VYVAMPRSCLLTHGRIRSVGTAAGVFQQAVAYDNARRQGSDKSMNPRLEALAPYAQPGAADIAE